MNRTSPINAARPALDLGGFLLHIEGGGHPAHGTLIKRMPSFFVHSAETPKRRLTLAEPDALALGQLPHAEQVKPRFETQETLGCVSVQAPGYAGRISADGTEAHLSLDPARPVEDLEYFVRLIAAQAAFAMGGMMLHAAAVMSRGSAKAFFGPSGSGKTTLARNAGKRRVLNDDLITLLPEEHGPGFTVHATPFANATQVGPSEPASATLSSLHRLEHALHNETRPLRPSIAVASLTACIPLISADPGRAQAVLERVERLLAAVPAGVLALTPDERFWPILEADPAQAQARIED